MIYPDQKAEHRSHPSTCSSSSASAKPVLSVVVDRPDRIHRWYEIVDELTDQTGLAPANSSQPSGRRAPTSSTANSTSATWDPRADRHDESRLCLASVTAMWFGQPLTHPTSSMT
jgi:hypothetical protein